MHEKHHNAWEEINAPFITAASCILLISSLLGCLGFGPLYEKTWKEMLEGTSRQRKGFISL